MLKGWTLIEGFHEYRVLQCTTLSISEHSEGSMYVGYSKYRFLVPISVIQ